MKSKIILAAVVTSLVSVLSAAAFAQTPGTNTPKIDKREANQEARIEKGVASGALNTKETARLEAGQAKVANAEANAKADGQVTAKERAKLNKMENRQSRNIKRQKHDKQVAPSRIAQ